MRIVVVILAANLLLAAALAAAFRPQWPAANGSQSVRPPRPSGRLPIYIVTPAGLDLQTLYEKQPAHVRALIESRYRLRFVEAETWPVTLDPYNKQ